MKKLTINTHEIFLLTQQEKAKELKLTSRTLYNHLKEKKFYHTIILPDMKRPYFISSSCPLDLPRSLL